MARIEVRHEQAPRMVSYDRFYKTAETMATGGSRMKQVLRYLGVAAIAALLTYAGITTRSTMLEWRGMRSEILALRILMLGDASKSLVGEVERQRVAKAEQKAKLDAARADAAKAKAAEKPAEAEAPKP